MLMVNSDSERVSERGPAQLFLGEFPENLVSIEGVGRNVNPTTMSVDPGFTGWWVVDQAREVVVRMPTSMFPVRSALQSAVALYGPSVGVVAGVGSTGSQWRLPVHAGR